MYKVLLIVLLAASLSTPLFAQSDEAEVTVVVTAERTPQPASQSISTATVITAKEIREQGARSVADVLRFVPGIALRSYGQPGSVATAIVRGTKANQLLVLVDGERVSSAGFISGADLSKFPVDEIARVEVIRGPVSSLYGSDATGGVINIITKRPTGEGGQTTLGFGAHGRAEKTLSFRGSSPDGSTWQFTGSTPAFDGIRPNSDYAATNISTRMILPSVKGWELSLRGEQYNDSLGLPGSDPSHTGYVDLDDRQWWKRRNLDISAKRQVGAGRFEWRTYRLEQELHNNAPGFDWMLNPVVYDSLITGTTQVMEANYSVERGKHKLIFGGDYRNEAYDDIETGASPSTQHNSIWNRALFVQDRIGLTPKTDLVLGTRYDDHSAAGGKMTPRVGITHAVSPRMRARASFAEGFRAPNFVELYYPEGPWGPGYSGNPSLKPENSSQYEIGFNLALGNDSIDLAVFHNSVRDLIQATSSTPYENIGHARQRGIELTWERRLGSSANLSLSYSYLDAENRTAGERLPGIPHNLISLTAAGMVQSWEIGLTGRWTDKRPDLAFDPVTWASSDVMLPGRVVMDLTLARHDGKRIEPYMTIRNLTNAAYEEVVGYRAEGRSIELGVRSAW
jgi:outer membrane cobalamin receptor